MKVKKIAYNPGSLLSTEEVLKFSKLADIKKNVDSLWVPESWGREAFASLGAVSQITQKARLGTSVISIYARTPATVAMGATTLDMLSNNRTIIGLGTSTETIVENWHGLKFEKPIGRMREYIECLRAMIKGEKVNYNGNIFKIKGFKILHKPQRSKIPIFVAAVNKNMISLASDIADGVLLFLRPIEELKKTVSRIKSNTYNNDRNFEIAAVFICSVSNNNPEKARTRVAKTLAFYMAVGKYYNRFLSENGYKKEVEEITKEYGINGIDSAAKLVPEKMLNSLTIYGTSEQCIKALSRFISTGITMPIIQVNPLINHKNSIKELLSTF